jgi:hypothetical protein
MKLIHFNTKFLPIHFRPQLSTRPIKIQKQHIKIVTLDRNCLEQRFNQQFYFGHFANLGNILYC